MSGAVIDALTSTEYNDVTGCVTVNVVDAMMAIANAINRLAASHEAMNLRGDKISAQLKEAMLKQMAEDEPGHA